MARTNETSKALDGQVERVVFRNEENGFCVLRVRVRDRREPVTVTGVAPSVNEGEWLAADGEWTVDARHGPQFKAAQLRFSRPSTTEGIERYLASGLIKGIGREYAARLVKTFGDKVFDVIESESGKLLKVPGIGRTRKDRIKAAWEEQKSVREIMSFLFSHGVTTTRAFRIHKLYGDRAIEIIQRDPYALARDVRGIGFLIADRIAMRLGIAKDSTLRLRAGLEFVLGELTAAGHCAYVRNDLISRTAELLEADLLAVETSLGASIEAKRLIARVDCRGRDLIYLPKLYFAEMEASRRLGELKGGKHPCPPVDFEKAMGWVTKKSGVELAPAQRRALQLALTSKTVVITGGPGVGKTTLLKALLMIFRAKKLRVALCAPTGRAAKRMSESAGEEAKTIHRLLQYNPGTGGFVHREGNPLECDVLVVDESSMIDVVLASQLLEAVPVHAAVVFVGDADQLPSVGPGRVLKDLIDSKAIPTALLDEVFRQAAGSRIILNAHRINAGKMPEFPESGAPSDCYFVEADDPTRAAELVCKLVRDSIPKRFGFDSGTEIQVLTPMRKGELGTNALNERLRALLNPRGEETERFGCVFRVGDKVMQTENDYEKDVFNGDVGRICGVDAETTELIVDFDGRRVAYDFRELDELTPAYAITIHKSQGSEYPCVVIPVHGQHFMLLQRSLVYTALTRARRLAIFVGSKRALGMAVSRTESRERITTLAERLGDIG